MKLKYATFVVSEVRFNPASHESVVLNAPPLPSEPFVIMSTNVPEMFGPCPNIMGTVDGYSQYVSSTGAFNIQNLDAGLTTHPSVTGYHAFGFDARRSSSIYKENGTVQSPALQTLACIRF